MLSVECRLRRRLGPGGGHAPLPPPCHGVARPLVRIYGCRTGKSCVRALSLRSRHSKAFQLFPLRSDAGRDRSRAPRTARPPAPALPRRCAAARRGSPLPHRQAPGHMTDLRQCIPVHTVHSTPPPSCPRLAMALRGRSYGFTAARGRTDKHRVIFSRH